jgi:hypothetical protein
MSSGNSISLGQRDIWKDSKSEKERTREWYLSPPCWNCCNSSEALCYDQEKATFYVPQVH